MYLYMNSYIYMLLYLFFFTFLACIIPENKDRPVKTQKAEGKKRLKIQ